MAGRAAIQPKLRWRVFARDGFRCRYCGATPPSAVLVIDHARPVARGGETTLENLVTACEDCNAGKSDDAVFTLPEYRQSQHTAQQVIYWLADVWINESGEAVDWMPVPEAFHEIMRYAAMWEVARDAVARYAAEARDSPGAADAILDRMYREFWVAGAR